MPVQSSMTVPSRVPRQGKKIQRPPQCLPQALPGVVSRARHDTGASIHLLRKELQLRTPFLSLPRKAVQQLFPQRSPASQLVPVWQSRWWAVDRQACRRHFQSFQVILTFELDGHVLPRTSLVELRFYPGRHAIRVHNHQAFDLLEHRLLLGWRKDPQARLVAILASPPDATPLSQCPGSRTARTPRHERKLQRLMQQSNPMQASLDLWVSDLPVTDPVPFTVPTTPAVPPVPSAGAPYSVPTVQAPPHIPAAAAAMPWVHTTPATGSTTPTPTPPGSRRPFSFAPMSIQQQLGVPQGPAPSVTSKPLSPTTPSPTRTAAVLVSPAEPVASALPLRHATQDASTAAMTTVIAATAQQQVQQPASAGAPPATHYTSAALFRRAAATAAWATPPLPLPAAQSHTPASNMTLPPPTSLSPSLLQHHSITPTTTPLPAHTSPPGTKLVPTHFPTATTSHHHPTTTPPGSAPGTSRSLKRTYVPPRQRPIMNEVYVPFGLWRDLFNGSDRPFPSGGLNLRVAITGVVQMAEQPATLVRRVTPYGYYVLRGLRGLTRLKGKLMVRWSLLMNGVVELETGWPVAERTHTDPTTLAPRPTSHTGTPAPSPGSVRPHTLPPGFQGGGNILPVPRLRRSPPSPLSPSPRTGAPASAAQASSTMHPTSSSSPAAPPVGSSQGPQ